MIFNVCAIQPLRGKKKIQEEKLEQKNLVETTRQIIPHLLQTLINKELWI